MTKLSIRGSKELERALKDLGSQFRATAVMVVEATALEIRGDVIKRYQRGPATGRTYKKYNPKRIHTASAPGEAPATDTGRLAGGTTYEKTGELSARIYNNIKYASMLEYGTFKIAPRHAWVPAVEAAQPKFLKRMEAAMASATK